MEISILSDDDSVSVCSTSSDVSSVWGGAQDPTTVNLRTLRKDMVFKNKVFTEEYARVSRLSGDDLEIDAPEPDQQRVGLARAICNYVRICMAAILEGYGGQDARKAVIISSKKARKTYLTTKFLHPDNIFDEVQLPTDQEILQCEKGRQVTDITIGPQHFDPRDAQRLRTSSPNKENIETPGMETQNDPEIIRAPAAAEDMLDPSSPNMPSYDTKVKSTEGWVDRGGQPETLFKYENENEEVTKLAQQAASLAQQEKDGQELQRQIDEETRILKEREDKREKKRIEKETRLQQQKLQQQQEQQRRQQQQQKQAKKEERERLINEQAQKLAQNEAQADQMRQILKDLCSKNNDQNLQDLREDIEDTDCVEPDNNPTTFTSVVNKRKSPKKGNDSSPQQQNPQNNGPLRPTQQELDQVRAAEKRDQQRKEHIHQQRLQQQQHQKQKQLQHS